MQQCVAAGAVIQAESLPTLSDGTAGQPSWLAVHWRLHRNCCHAAGLGCQEQSSCPGSAAHLYTSNIIMSCLQSRGVVLIYRYGHPSSALVSSMYIYLLRTKGPWYVGGVEQGAITLQPCIELVDRWVLVQEEDIARAMLAIKAHDHIQLEGVLELQLVDIAHTMHCLHSIDFTCAVHLLVRCLWQMTATVYMRRLCGTMCLLI